MAVGRKCVIKKVMPHDEFIDRIRKSFYFGSGTLVEEMQMSLPLASYASELFSNNHKGYSLNRLSTYSAGKIQASPCSLIMALIFLERLNAVDPCYVRRITPQELFIVSMMISTKFYSGYDEAIYLSDWAAEGNMTEEKLKKMELEFLCAIDWNIYISNEEFFRKLSAVEKTLAKREGIRRGWLTYSEVEQLLPLSLNTTKLLLSTILNHLTVMIVSYAAGVLTIAGAFLLASHVPGHMLHRTAKPTTNVSTQTESTLQSIHNPMERNSSSEAPVNDSQASLATVLERHNATCNALNVEAELLNMEQQYRKEEAEIEMRKNRNECMECLLPSINMQQSSVPLKAEKQEQKWLTFKEMYSDPGLCHKSFGYQSLSSSSTIFKEPFKNVENRTSDLIWKLFTDLTQPSFVRLPIVWFKFI